MRKIWIQFNDQFHEISIYIFKLTTSWAEPGGAQRSPTSAEGRGRVASLYPGLFPAATYVAVQSDCSVVKC